MKREITFVSIEVAFTGGGNPVFSVSPTGKLQPVQFSNSVGAVALRNWILGAEMLRKQYGFEGPSSTCSINVGGRTCWPWMAVEEPVK